MIRGQSGPLAPPHPLLSLPFMYAHRTRPQGDTHGGTHL